MQAGEKAALLALKGNVLTDIDVRDIEDALMSFGLLSVSDKERIHAGPRSRQQETSTLVDIILEKNRPNTFDVFLESVKQPYQHVWTKLVDAQKSPESALSHGSSEAIFIEGGVPIAPRGNVELEFVPALKEALVALSQRRDGGWVIIWGQAGSGKSVMAAQAVRGAFQGNRAIAAYFYNRVFWFTIGRLPKEKSRFEAALLVKMQNILRRLNSGTSSDQPSVVSSLDAARDLLRSTLLKQYPVCLVVLDDVWDSLVLKYFDVQSRVLVTTRSSDILGRIRRGHKDRCQFVHVSKGFTEAASISLLNELVPLHDSGAALSAERASKFRTIHKECEGSPFVVSIFGSLLRGSMAKFDYFLRRYNDNLLQGRTELESGDYDYADITEAIMVSIEDLDDTDRDLFLRLSIFTSSSYQSPALLSAYCWTDMDADEALEKMEEFVRRSLATEEKTPAGLQLFTVHDLILSVLRTKYKDETVAYNDQFVANVLQRRQEHSSWHDLQDDCEYLAYNFIYHLVNVHESQMSHEAKGELLLDFDFICWLSCRIGPDSLVFAYRFAVKLLKLSDTCQQMEKFLRSPVFRIQSLCLAGGRQSAPAVIQLALSFADGADLQQHVREAALKHWHGACFYEWVNRAQTEEQITDTQEVGCNATSFALNAAATHAAVASDYAVSIRDLQARRTIYRCLDKKFSSDRVVAVAFGSDNESLWLLTASRLVKYCLPQGTLDATIVTSPSTGSIQPRRYSLLIFPAERPRSYSNEVQSLEEPGTDQQLVWQDEERPGVEFTTMCFCGDQRLVIGSRAGRIYELTLTNTFINCCYQYQIDRLPSGPESSVSHIASSSDTLAISGPSCCVHVYENRPNDGHTASYANVRKYAGFQEQGRPPVKSLLTSRFVASISGSEIHLWHPTSLKTLVTEPGQYNAEFTSLAMSSDCVYLAASTSRAHIYLYRVLTPVESMRNRFELELVDEFNGTGTRARSLTFGSRSCLYSLSEVSNESVLTKWRAIASNASPCFRRPVDRQSSIFFGNECCTLRLRTAFDAVATTSPNRIVVACQSVRRSLLILESTGASFKHIAKYKGDSGAQLKKALAVGMSPDGQSAVFTFDSYVVTAAVTPDGSWQFSCRPEAVSIKELVMLPDCSGFIGSDKESTLVAYGNGCTERLDSLMLEHSRLLPLPQKLVAAAATTATDFPDARAVVLTPHSWHFVTEALVGVSNAEGSLADLGDADEACGGSHLCCLDVADGGQCVAGGLSDGRLALWRLGEPNGSASCVRREGTAATTALRCVRFAPGSRAGRLLLAGAFDDGSVGLWRLTLGGGEHSHGVDCRQLLAPTSVNGRSRHCGVDESASSSSCFSLAWSVTAASAVGADHHRLGDNARRSSCYRLILAAADCVWLVCRLSEQDAFGGDDDVSPALDAERCLSRVPLYSRQGVAKALVLGPDGDLLYVDNAHTVFWMRNLLQSTMQLQQRRCSVP